MESMGVVVVGGVRIRSGRFIVVEINRLGSSLVRKKLPEIKSTKIYHYRMHFNLWVLT